MCTIFTVDKKKYDDMGTATVTSRILVDAMSNDDGGSLVFLDPKSPHNNTIFRTMNAYLLVDFITQVMLTASAEARMFVHLRAATTWNTGVSYTHGFDDMNGVVYMHNGILSNPKGYTVDSFKLIAIGATTANELWTELFTANERFANIFRIDTDNYKYAVVRMTTGSLYSDGKGNYSTNKIKGLINHPVKLDYHRDHLIGTPELESRLRSHWLPDHLEYDTDIVPQSESTVSVIDDGHADREWLHWINKRNVSGGY